MDGSSTHQLLNPCITRGTRYRYHQASNTSSALTDASIRPETGQSVSETVLCGKQHLLRVAHSSVFVSNSPGLGVARPPLMCRWYSRGDGSVVLLPATVPKNAKSWLLATLPLFVLRCARGAWWCGSAPFTDEPADLGVKTVSILSRYADSRLSRSRTPHHLLDLRPHSGSFRAWCGAISSDNGGMSRVLRFCLICL